MKNLFLKKTLLGGIAVLFLALLFCWFFGKNKTENLNFQNKIKIITLIDGGLENKIFTQSNTVGEFIEKNNIPIKENDLLLPEKETPLYSGINIEIKRSFNIKIKVDGKIIENWTRAKDIRTILQENGVILSSLDQTQPEKTTPPNEGLNIIVTRINEEEKTIIEKIDFKTIVKKDSALGWREKKTQQKGEKGNKEIIYKITYQDGKEISRKILSQKIVQEPQNEIVIEGTFIKLGDSHKGQGTWYSFQGGLYAASPWLPMGSYAKVTNQSNGKSVIVEINDRGPFGDGRIIDLDKKAFAKIADLGTGVINVKVEEILN